MMHCEWIDAAENLPAKPPDSSFSAYVIVWVQYRNDFGFWAGDRFDYSRGEWELHGSYEGATITHWMHGPHSPHKS